jgi:PAS domain S-box-containing protein
MLRFFRFSPSRLALAYIALSVFVLALFAIPLWYAWQVNLSTFKEYVQGEDIQRLVEVFAREGAKGLATTMESQVRSLPGDEIMIFADASKLRLAGNLPAWPAEVPDAPGTYGLVIGLGGGSTMRVVASHVRLPGGYHLLMGRESVRFESLVERFWYGITGAMLIVVVLGAVIGWLSHRALLSEVREISRTASAIVEGDLSRRVATRGGSDELDTLARTVNGMLEQLARQNVQLESEISERRQAEQALHRAHDDLEGLVTERTGQLARANESLHRTESYLAEAQRLSQTGSWAFNVATREIVHWSQEYFCIFGFDPEQGMPSFETFLQRIHPDDRVRATEVIERAVRERTDHEQDCRIVLPDGTMKYIHAIGHPVFNSSGELVEFVGTVIDATERKRAEEERHAHLWFLESMDQVNRAIQGTNDLEQMMSDVLDAVLAILNCDRAWLVYPCDPEAPSWKVPMEHARPEFPGLFVLGLDLPVDPEIAKVFQTVRASSSPVRFGPGSKHRLPAEAAQRFSIQSMIGMAIYPKGDKPYMLGLHQCSYPRVWTPQEERLFQEIGRRLEDALTGLLMFRNLGESERKLEEAQRLTHVGYWERDADTDLITWSDETYRIFGLQPQARTLNLAQLPELIHPEDKQIVVQAVAEALRGGPRYDVEYRVIRPNGEVRLVHSQGDITRDESGRPRRMFGTVQDITERKQAEQHLVAQYTVTQILAEAATLQEATPKILRAVCECLVWDVGALWSIDREAGVLRCVEVWHKESVEIPEFEATSRKSTFMPGIGLPGRVWSSHEPAYIPDVVHDANFLRAPIAAREVLHAAFGFPILLGGEVLGVIEFFSAEIRQPEQDLLNMMATIGSQIGQFIERKRAEDALHHAQMELAHVTRVATLGEMSASIAHEINQPLAAVVNNANACLRWLAGPTPNLEEARQSAALITADGHRAGEIISRIRALAKKAPPRKDWLDINETIRDVIAFARSEVQRNGVALETRLSDDVHYVPLILADRIQLQQVILNLMMNAIEAMSGAGEGPRELLVRSGTAESQRVLVAVRDSGPGLDPKSLDRLFDAFYTTKPHGLGMGLAICRSIVEAHSGRLWATANEDRGATFQFTLPTGGEKAS